MAKETVEEAVVEAVVAPVVEEKNIWEESGYAPELARICDNLSHLEETPSMPQEILTVITRTQSGKTVDDFNDLTDGELEQFLHVIRNQLPTYHSAIVAAIRDIGRAKPIVVDDDFI